MTTYPRLAGYPNIYLNNGGQVTSSGCDSSYPLTNLGWRPYPMFRAKLNTASSWIKVAFINAVTANCWAICGHNAYTKNNVITLRASNDDATYTEIFTTGTKPPNNNAIVKCFASQSWKYWKTTFGTYANQEVGVLYLGNYLEFPEFQTTPDPDAHEMSLRNLRTDAGLILGNNYEHSTRKIDINVEFLYKDWVINTFKPWWALAKRYPMFYSWNWGDYPLESYYMNLAMDQIRMPKSGVFITPLQLKLIGLMEE